MINQHLSIVIPFYNPPYEAFKTCLETIHMLNPLDVILVDDCSTDAAFREDERHDPLVLDTNHDGFIATTVLDESTTYFDITGDGIREKVGWVSGEDALLVYDKNENGQIDGIDEMFGNVA